jgi:hypothetical protein
MLSEYLPTFREFLTVFRELQDGLKLHHFSRNFQDINQSSGRISNFTDVVEKEIAAARRMMVEAEGTVDKERRGEQMMRNWADWLPAQ